MKKPTRKPGTRSPVTQSPQALPRKDTIVCPRCGRNHVPTTESVQQARIIARRDAYNDDNFHTKFARYSEFCMPCLQQKGQGG